VGTVRSRIFRAREFLDERVLAVDKKNWTFCNPMGLIG
jgi:hypothetical protein